MEQELEVREVTDLTMFYGILALIGGAAFGLWQGNMFAGVAFFCFLFLLV